RAHRLGKNRPAPSRSRLCTQSVSTYETVRFPCPRVCERLRLAGQTTRLAHPGFDRDERRDADAAPGGEDTKAPSGARDETLAGAHGGRRTDPGTEDSARLELYL